MRARHAWVSILFVLYRCIYILYLLAFDVCLICDMYEMYEIWRRHKSALCLSHSTPRSPARARGTRGISLVADAASFSRVPSSGSGAGSALAAGAVAQHDTSSNYYATSLPILMCIIPLLYIMYLILSQLVYLKVLTSVGFFSATVKNLILLTYLCRWLKAEQSDNIFKTKSRFLMLMHTLDISPHKKGPALLAGGEQWARRPNGGENWFSLILVITIELSPAVRTG